MWSFKHQNGVYDFIDIPEFEFKQQEKLMTTSMKWNCAFLVLLHVILMFHIKNILISVKSV